MKTFVKGMIIGGLVGSAVGMWKNDNMYNTSKKMMKKGRQFAKKMNII